MSWKCQSCDLKFETEIELKIHQKDKRRCVSCCHILCPDCNKTIENGTMVVRCCQCGKTNY